MRMQTLESDMHLLASIQWPLLMSIWYWSDEVYPNVMPSLLANAPRLKWLMVSIWSNQVSSIDVANMFGLSVWSNLQGVCIRNQNAPKETMLPDQAPAMQQACPNATIHILLSKRDGADSRLYYGHHLSPQCDWACYKCVLKYYCTF
jgi:hypothetical protein